MINFNDSYHACIVFIVYEVLVVGVIFPTFPACIAIQQFGL